MPLPSRRYKLDQIRNHIWMKKKFKDCEKTGLLRTNSSSTGGGVKRLCSGLDLPAGVGCEMGGRLSLSQPAPPSSDSGSDPAGHGDDQTPGFHAFTQPAQLDNMLVSTQGSTQSSQSQLQRLVKRMTRFHVNTDMETTEKLLKSRLASMKYTTKIHTTGVVTISCIDRRRNNLVFKASLVEMGKEVLLDFRLSKGDGIEFKRNFTKIKKVMEEHIVKAPPISWSLAIYNNKLPGV